MWSAWEEPMLEHLLLTTSGGEIFADGMIVGLREGNPLRVRYKVRCDAAWRVRSVRVAALDSSKTPGVDLLSDGEGSWKTRGGEAAPELDGCVDVDISATPFTNTLPIRRLGLAPGESVDIAVAYVGVGEMQVWDEPQRYTCLERRSDGGLYRFKALDGGFMADLPVDADSLVLDYPDLFRRVFSG